MSIVSSNMFFSTNLTSSTLEFHLSLLGLALILLYLTYEKVLKPPPSLRHIPHLNFFALFKGLIMHKNVDEIINDISRSDVVQSSSNGIYLRRDSVCWTVRVTRPEDVKVVLARKDLFQKSVESIALRRGTLVGRVLYTLNVILSVGDDYKRQRKVIHPAFRRPAPINLYTTLSQKAIDSIETDKSIDAHTLCHAWTMDIMMAHIFGHDLDALGHKTSKWTSLFESIARVGQNTLYLALPFMERNFLKYVMPDLRKAHRDMTVYADMLNSVVQRKREAVLMGKMDGVDDKEKDLLTLMIEASMQGKEHFSAEEFQANVFALFLAGHDTNSATLSFALYYLAEHQDLQERAREEAISVFGDDHNIHPTYQETQNLPYITMIIKETLRINPPISLPDRVATTDTEIAGTFIPKGTLVGITVHELHRNPKVWKDPDVFDPERFAPGGEVDQINGLAWIPFGNGGVRVCTGMKETMTMLRIALSMLLQKYKWHLPEDSIHKNGLQTIGYGAVRPKNLKLVFKKRY